MENGVARFFRQWSEDQDKVKELSPEIARGFGGLFQATRRREVYSIGDVPR